MKPDAESQIRREELAFRQGAKAFTQGRTENPYNPGSRVAEAFRNGYRDAQRRFELPF